MKKSSAFIAALVAFSLSHAQAADLGSRSAPMLGGTDTTANFSGVYLSASGGMEFMTTGIGIDGAPLSLSGIGSDGWSGEAQVGYDWQPRGARAGIGVFAGANIASTETTLTIGNLEANETTLTIGNLEAKYGRDWGWLIGARAFATVTDDTMIYVGGGYTQADFTIKLDGASLGTETIDGFFGEVGMETKLTNNVFGKISARYTAYDKVGDGFYVEPESLQALAGLTFKLN